MDSSLPQYLRDLAANIRKSPLTIADLCLRDDLIEGPDIVALIATHGSLDYRQALASVRSLLAGELMKLSRKEQAVAAEHPPQMARHCGE